MLFTNELLSPPCQLGSPPPHAPPLQMTSFSYLGASDSSILWTCPPANSEISSPPLPYSLLCTFSHCSHRGGLNFILCSSSHSKEMNWERFSIMNFSMLAYSFIFCSYFVPRWLTMGCCGFLSHGSSPHLPSTLPEISCILPPNTFS